MNLPVNSYLELYTTLYGWLIYDLVWDLLVQTMIAFLPMGWIIVQNWRDAITSSDERPPATVSVKRTGMDLAIAFLVLWVAGLPMYQLTPTLLSYTPRPSFDNLNPGPVNPLNDPSTYKDTLGAVVIDGGVVEIPMWWWFVSSMSSGLAHAVAMALPKEGDIRAAQQQLGQVNIKEPAVAAEYGRFIRDCFGPARAKVQRVLTTYGVGGVSSTVGDAFNEYGPGDVEWAGSHAFLETQGLYQPCTDSLICGAGLYARQTIEGWPDSVMAQEPVPGTPWCADWWNGAGAPGLKEKLLAQDADNDTLWTKIKAAFSQLTGTDPAVIEDARIKNLLRQNAAGQLTRSFPQISASGVVAGTVERAAELGKWLANTFGIASSAAGFNTALDAIKMLLPMIQAIMLMGVFALLPFAIVISAYRWEHLFVLTLLVFSLYFLTALWAIANFVDQYLVRALWPTEGAFVKFLLNDPDNALNKRMLLDVLTGSLFIGLPLLWFALMGMVGVGALQHTGRTMGHVGDRATGGASQGGDMVTKQASGAVGGTVSRGVGKVTGGGSGKRAG